MPATDTARERLQRTLLGLARATTAVGERVKTGRRSHASRGMHSGAGSASSDEPRPVSPPEPQHIEGRLVPAGLDATAHRATTVSDQEIGEGQPARESQMIDEDQAIGDGLGELLDRLERIEERLADLQRPQRPVPATREIFAEWVRLRQWESMAFGEFLRLRRSGRV